MVHGGVVARRPFICELHCPSTACEHMRRARTSAPYGVQACHACTHLQRPGGLPAAPTACSEREETVAAPCHQPRSVGVVERDLRAQTNARSILQRFELFAWDLQPALQGSHLQCWSRMRAAYHAMPRLAARLRAAFARFFALANADSANWLSAGATRQVQGCATAHKCGITDQTASPHPAGLES